MSAETCEKKNIELDSALNHATIASCLSDEFNNLRAVEEIQLRKNKIAIAYARGASVIFNVESKEIEKIFYSKNNLQIEALDWFDENQIILGKSFENEVFCKKSRKIIFSNSLTRLQ